MAKAPHPLLLEPVWDFAIGATACEKAADGGKAAHRVKAREFATMRLHVEYGVLAEAR